MRQGYYTFLFFLFSTSLFSAELVTKSEHIRLGVGISTLASRHMDDMISEIAKETEKIEPGVKPVSYGDNLAIFFEYESMITERLSYLIYVQYTSNEVKSENSDITSKVDQGLRFDYSIYQGGLVLAYDIPIFNIGASRTSLITGAGLDISFIETVSFYYYDQRPAFVQTLESKRNGGILGGRFFVGWKIPYVESLSLQLRAGYDLRPTRKLPGETVQFSREVLPEDRDLMDPEVFDSYDTYNFSQLWITFSVAYLF